MFLELKLLFKSQKQKKKFLKWLKSLLKNAYKASFSSLERK
jgi:hypothetical protein